MPLWNAWIAADTIRPDAPMYPTMLKDEKWKPEHKQQYVAYPFEAANRQAAEAIMTTLKRDGIPQSASVEPEQEPVEPPPPPVKLWRHRGHPDFIDAQGPRLGLPPVETYKARNNKEIHAASTILGQLTGHYHRIRKEGTLPVGMTPQERAQIADTFRHVELEISRLHALAAASVEMANEGYRAFHIPIPARGFSVVAASDTVSVTEKASE